MKNNKQKIVILDNNFHTYANKNRFEDEYIRTYDEYVSNSTYEKYKSRRHEEKTSVKFGQLKLLVSEIEFMNMCISKLGGADIQILFLYVCAAPGTHTAMLIEMYRKLLPNLSWCLVDPREFDPKLRKYPNVVALTTR